MNQQRKQKLKPLLEDLPPGFLCDAAWLTDRGIDRKSILNYVRQGWLEKLTRGVYRRPLKGGSGFDANFDWRITLISIQRILKNDVHVGSRTALSLHGLEHYVSPGDKGLVHLYGRPPTWLKRLPDAWRYVVHSRTLFGEDTVGIEHTEFDQNREDGGSPVAPWDWPMVRSTRERAVFELLDELPHKESFHIVDKFFESFTGARPRLLEKLLAACRSKKVKRLFFVFADRHNHAWRKHIDSNAFDLGSGPRSLVEGGRFHPVYMISVPPEYIPESLEQGDVE